MVLFVDTSLTGFEGMGRLDVTDFVRERIPFLEQTVLVFHWEVIVSQLVGSLSKRF